MPEARREILNLASVRQDFRLLKQQRDIGGTRIIARWFLSPPNIFDPNSRTSLKPEALIVLSYFLLLAVAFAAFNLR